MPLSGGFLNQKGKRERKMKIKFLKNEEITIEKKPFKIVMNPVSTGVQTRMMDLSMLGTVSESVQRVQYLLKNVVKALEIDGKDYSPVELANNVDLSDKDTRDAFIEIGKLVMDKAFPDEETIKK